MCVCVCVMTTLNLGVSPNTILDYFGENFQVSVVGIEDNHDS